MPRDNISLAGTWALLNGDGGCSITIARTGESATQSINIPRRDFDAIIDWYMRPVKIEPKQNRRRNRP
jgi:hypothetical protein